MLILQISSAKNFGGGEKHLVDLTKGLRRKNQEVFVALSRENNWQEQFSFLPEENIIYLPLRNSLDVFSARKLAKFIREKQIEIVHAHLARDYPIAATAVRLQPTAKLVFTRHLLLPLKRFHKLTASQVAGVIGVSNAVRESLIKQQIFSPEKIKLILNGTDVEDFAQNMRQTDKQNLQEYLQVSLDTFLVGTVGELKSIKGQDLFLQSAASVAEKISKFAFHRCRRG